MLALASKVNTLVVSHAPLAFVQTEGRNHNAHGIAGFLSELAGPPIGPATESVLRFCQAVNCTGMCKWRFLNDAVVSSDIS